MNPGKTISSTSDHSQQSPSLSTSFSEHGNSTTKPGGSNGGKRMPDWLTHSLIGWITGKTTKQEISLLVIGALIPDITKLYLLFNPITQPMTQDFFLPIHTPFGAILIALCIALFFQDIKKAFIPLTIGIATHFILDFFLLNVSGGMPLLYPFSWQEWQLGLIRSDDYTMTILALLAAVIVYISYRIYEKRKIKNNNI